MKNDNRTRLKKMLIALVLVGVGVLPVNVLAQTEPLVLNGAPVGFEGGAVPSDWSITSAALPGGEWVVSTDNSSPFWQPGLAPEGNYYASANDDLPGFGSDGSVDYLISNVFTLRGASSATLTFDYHFNGAYGHIRGGVEVSGDGGLSWDGETVLAVGNAWQTHVLNLDAYVNNANVRVRFHSDDGGSWAAGYAVDNIRLSGIMAVPTSVPTMPVWILILLTLAMATVGALGVTRRR